MPFLCHLARVVHAHFLLEGCLNVPPNVAGMHGHRVTPDTSVCPLMHFSLHLIGLSGYYHSEEVQLWHWLTICVAPGQATKAPFINAIFDREPLQRWVFGRVVLVGEAAHPTSPHALRSTNMAICDAGAAAAACMSLTYFRPK